MTQVVDLFAGPGGWEMGARDGALDLSITGIEYDGWTCLTRNLAGHATIPADVATLNPDDFAHLPGFIASPPCQLFSAAGSGHGRSAVDLLAQAIRDALDPLNDGHDVRPAVRKIIADTVEPTLLEMDGYQGAFDFDNLPSTRRARAEAMAYQAALVIEPARWVDVIRPRWVALEQVPAVLPLWEAMAESLELVGYSAWAGVVNAADYGVPQTRKRAILLASLDHDATRPPPTHAQGGAGGLEPWVSMADALGWGDITTGQETMRGAGMRDRHGARPLPEPDDPSNTVTGKARSWKLVMKQRRYSDGGRDADQPAMTILGSADNGDYVFLNTGRDWKPGGTRDDAQTLPIDLPAPTLTGKGGTQWQWTTGRPATTVMGDQRIWPPGHKINADDRARLGDDEAAARYGDRAGTDALKLEVWQALLLQTFPADYPVQGPLREAFLQVGNAVPPLLARRLLEHVI